MGSRTIARGGWLSRGLRRTNTAVQIVGGKEAQLGATRDGRGCGQQFWLVNETGRRCGCSTSIVDYAGLEDPAQTIFFWALFRQTNGPPSTLSPEAAKWPDEKA
jgi:hypothetical protein